MTDSGRMPPESTADRVLLLISKKAGIRQADLSLDSRLLHDLGITGDDAAELIECLAEEFNISVATFPFDTYFTGEPSVLHVLYALRIRKKPLDKEPLTVRQLVAWVEQRRAENAD